MGNDPKNLFSSKTIWFNVFMAVFPLLADHVELMRSYLSDGGYLLLMMFVGAVNVYLRSITTQPVRLGK